MQKRLAFRCPNPDCNRKYEMTFTFEGQPRLYVECPYCGTGGTVTLNKYHISQDNVIMRGENGQGATVTESYEFPTLVPVEPRDDKEQ